MARVRARDPFGSRAAERGHRHPERTFMTGWVILVDQPKDLPNADTPHKMITTSEYLARPRLFDMGRPKLVNLARSYAYQSKGYYASLLAEARGHRVVPTVETMLELRESVLYDPNEKMAPSSPSSIKHFARIAEKLSVDIEPITKRQLAELAEYDGLFIRETTSIDNHTYRFARRAWQEGMPVIDDPISMIRCTNKVFLMELLGQNQVATPPTVMLADVSDLARATEELGLPLVVKIPDGSFSRGVHKVQTPEELRRVADELFEETDLLLAQKFLPTEFDWRVGVLAGEPLFVCQYRMARGHWQIVKHRADGSSREGGFKTFDIDQAPPALIDIAVRAARPIGDGFYGVDVKQTDKGFVVMEVNDNPNLEHGIEDQVGKDEIWTRLLKWFIERFEQ